MKFKILAASAAACTLVGLDLAAAAVTVHTSAFIGAADRFNGFEDIGPWDGSEGFYPGTSGYTEGGITVTYVTGDGDAGIWTTFLKEGSYSWYNSGGGYGYTQVKLASGGDFKAIQFTAWSGGNSYGLQYMLRREGEVVATGDAGDLSFVSRTYGFSGGLFDEVWLQNRIVLPRPSPFEVGSYEGLGIDSISIQLAGQPVPEPAMWTLLISGFGIAGGALRRLRRSERLRMDRA